MHSNTIEVIRFEITRNIKKPSFWIAALLIPIVFAIYIGIAAFSGYSAGEAAVASSDTTKLKLALVDDANFLNYKEGSNSFINRNGDTQAFEIYPDKATALDALKKDTFDILYVIPEDFQETRSIEIHAKPDTPKITDDYTEPIKLALSNTVEKRVDDLDIAIIRDDIDNKTTVYNSDNTEYDLSSQVSKIVVPAATLALFYFIVVIFGNRLSVAMTEEKENRISELLLTSISPNSLIVGKVFSLMVLGIVQILVTILPVAIIYLFAKSNGYLPEEIVINISFISMLPYIFFLFVAYYLFTIINILIGVLTPTAKDASSYTGILTILIVLPILTISAFMNEPNLFAYIISYIPFSAPIAMMLRDIFGNLQSWEIYVEIAISTITSILITKLAVNIFQKNAIEFNSKINLKRILGSTRTTWKK